MKKAVRASSESVNFKTVKSSGAVSEDLPLLFSFSSFKAEAISIKRFNNHYRDIDEYVRKMSILFRFGLPLLSREKASIFSDLSKMNTLHLHKIKGKDNLLRKIFNEYGYNSEAIENILDDGDIYQLEIPYENGATRIVFLRAENVISFLFLDPNHHIYLNEQKTTADGSLFYEVCPVNEANLCKRMDYLHTCFMFDFLDEKKYRETYGYKVDYDKAGKQ